MNKWFRFLIHAVRLRSFALAAWVADYEETERRFHTARRWLATKAEKATHHRPAERDFVVNSKR